MQIIAHYGIDGIKLQEQFSTTMDSGENLSYTVVHPIELVVEMDYCPSVSSSNSQGWKRNKDYYFNQLYLSHPEYFSEENKFLLQEGDSPICDNTFVEFFPQYSKFVGETLIHHHIGEDGQAVALCSNN